MLPNHSIISQLANAESPEERSRLIDIFLLLAAVGDRVRALREARETEQQAVKDEQTA
jgi:hypothetical protein